MWLRGQVGLLKEGVVGTCHALCNEIPFLLLLYENQSYDLQNLLPTLVAGFLFLVS